MDYAVRVQSLAGVIVVFLGKTLYSNSTSLHPHINSPRCINWYCNRQTYIGESKWSLLQDLEIQRRKGDFHIKRTGLLVVPLRVKKAFLILLLVSSLKRSTARAFVVPSRVLSQKHLTGDLLN